MSKKVSRISCWILILLTVAGCGSTKSKTNKFVQFDNDLKEYIQSGTSEWVKANGIISCNVGEGYIYTKDEYKNFHLKAEFLADETVNSGIFFGCEGDEMGARTCFEANIWDNHPNQDWRTGSLVTRQSPLKKVETIGKWSSYEIKSENGKIQIWIDSILTVDYRVSEVKMGPIIFQKFGEGKIQFRNIRIHQID